MLTRSLTGRFERMGLMKYFVQGFGWRVGAKAAEEAIDEFLTGEDDESEPEDKEPGAIGRWKQRRAEKKARKEAEKARAAAEKARIEAERAAEKAIDDEIAAMKKKIASER